MNGGDSSRPETDAGDYFGNQKKKLDLADRRPVIRKASDLVGPGIAGAAVRITDFNDVLATFNGYYSAAADAANAPNDTGEFVGFVTMDSEYGGRQVFTDLEDGSDYTRVFRRAPADPETITWGPWRRRWGATPTAIGALGWVYTTVPTGGGGAPLLAPAVVTNGADDLYSTGYGSGGTSLNIEEQGIYTGHITVYGPPSVPVEVTVNAPSVPLASPIDQVAVLSGYFRIPFTAMNTSLVPTALTVEARQSSGGSQNIAWTDVQIVRVGDAI